MSENETSYNKKERYLLDSEPNTNPKREVRYPGYFRKHLPFSPSLLYHQPPTNLSFHRDQATTGGCPNVTIHDPIEYVG
jgi:hypothetical protein